MTVEDVLMIKGPDVLVGASSDTVSEAAKLMSEGGVGALIIKDGNDIRGIFTEQDLLRRVVAKKKDPLSTELEKVMSTPIKSCRLGDDIIEIADRMTKERIRHLAVIEDNAVIGVISVRDLLAAELRMALDK